MTCSPLSCSPEHLHCHWCPLRLSKWCWPTSHSPPPPTSSGKGCLPIPQPSSPSFTQPARTLTSPSRPGPTQARFKSAGQQSCPPICAVHAEIAQDTSKASNWVLAAAWFIACLPRTAINQGTARTAVLNCGVQRRRQAGGVRVSRVCLCAEEEALAVRTLQYTSPLSNPMGPKQAMNSEAMEAVQLGARGFVVRARCVSEGVSQ